MRGQCVSEFPHVIKSLRSENDLRRTHDSAPSDLSARRRTNSYSDRDRITCACAIIKSAPCPPRTLPHLVHGTTRQHALKRAICISAYAAQHTTRVNRPENRRSRKPQRTLTKPLNARTRKRTEKTACTRECILFALACVRACVRSCVRTLSACLRACVCTCTRARISHVR